MFDHRLKYGQSASPGSSKQESDERHQFLHAKVLLGGVIPMHRQNTMKIVYIFITLRGTRGMKNHSDHAGYRLLSVFTRFYGTKVLKGKTTPDAKSEEQFSFRI